MNTDFSELDSLTARLERVEERRSLALDMANVGLWDWNIETGELYWDEVMFDIYGIKKEDFHCGYQDWIKRVHPEDQERAEKLIKDCLESNKPYIFRFRIVRPNEKEIIVSGFGNCIRKAGVPKRMVGINVLEHELCEKHYSDRLMDGPCENCPSKNICF